MMARNKDAYGSHSTSAELAVWGDSRTRSAIYTPLKFWQAYISGERQDSPTPVPHKEVDRSAILLGHEG
jgi:hypothetical protein